MITPQQFRKKPVTIDAIQWTGDNILNVRGWAGCDSDHFIFHGPDRTLRIVRLYDLIIVQPGWMLFREHPGEIEACAPDLFAAIYEPVNQETP